MARYSQFLGRRVEVQYRAGDIVLPASGLFVADSGRSIFLEQNLEQRGLKHFRWEIPYQYLVKIEEIPETVPASAASPAPNAVRAESAEPAKARATASAAASGLLSFSQKPKTA
jgi:hypothetical protein